MAYLLDKKPYQVSIAENDTRAALLAHNYSDKTEEPMILMSRTYDPLLNFNDIVIITDNEVVLNNTKKNIEIFYITAHYLRANKMEQDLEMLADVSREYLIKKIDPLLDSRENGHSSDVHKALTEIEYIKANLLYEINDFEHACDTVSDLESSYHHDATGELGVLSKRLTIYKNPYIVMTDFSYMCHQK
jgi:hypothetical protein